MMMVLLLLLEAVRQTDSSISNERAKHTIKSPSVQGEEEEKSSSRDTQLCIATSCCCWMARTWRDYVAPEQHQRSTTKLLATRGSRSSSITRKKTGRRGRTFKERKSETKRDETLKLVIFLQLITSPHYIQMWSQFSCSSFFSSLSWIKPIPWRHVVVSPVFHPVALHEDVLSQSASRADPPKYRGTSFLYQ